jgi:hypothetical protein
LRREAAGTRSERRLMFDFWQRATYEASASLGPIASALMANFAIVIAGELYLTPAGERYLAALDQELTA